MEAGRTLMIDQSEIKRLMDEAGFSDQEARFVLAHQYGPNLGDVKTEPPMKEREWRRRGLGVLATPATEPQTALEINHEE